MKIEQIDKNFAVPQFDGLDIEWYDIRKGPFKLYGLIDTGTQYIRMSEDVAEKVNDGVKQLSGYTSGGRVRFSTDSPFIALIAEQPDYWIPPHMTTLCSAGFDIYCEDEKGYVGSFCPDTNTKKNRSIVRFEGRDRNEGIHSFTINFPLYANVFSVYIGIQKGSILKEGMAYSDKLPIIYYGSSITQGGCASRPGMCYQNIICRRNNIDYVNLGFSGSAKGEDVMAEYVSDIPMSVFVYDYDHNAPTAEHLQNTHERFFKIFRKKQPDTPVIMLSKPCTNINDYDNLKRRNIIKKTYMNAIKSGDNNVYFIDGNKMLKGDCANDCFVDYCHPTDIGFMRMAKAIEKELNKIL